MTRDVIESMFCQVEILTAKAINHGLSASEKLSLDVIKGKIKAKAAKSKWHENKANKFFEELEEKKRIESFYKKLRD